jgi:hypothetical protein
MDVDSRIKVLTRRITVHKSEIPSGRDSSSQATHLQLRQFIGQDLAALELCFENQKDFNDYTTKHFNWKYAMCHLYIVYYRFMNDYPMFVYSGLPWTTIRNECTKWRRWLILMSPLSLVPVKRWRVMSQRANELSFGENSFCAFLIKSAIFLHPTGYTFIGSVSKYCTYKGSMRK